MQPGLFDLQDRYADLSKSGNPLKRLLSMVNFEVFRPPLDAVMMVKILMLQALYGLSDEQAEYQIRDRLCSCGSSVWGWTTGFRTGRRSACSARRW